MFRSFRLLLLFSFPLVIFGQTAAPSTSATPVAPLTGYTAQASAAELQWEQKFQAIPSPENLRADMQHLAARPHHVGSPYDKANAEWLLAQFRNWGWDAHIETFYVLFPTPKERLLELIAPTKFTATLREPPIPGDPTSYQQSEQLPTYNAYSPDGDVTAPLVYVNYGNNADYVVLDRMGISVKGAIVIARYGGEWRGIKAKVAAEHGAIGCIIYSDPRDDGYSADDVYPKGSGRPREGVQRGAVTDDYYEGDPLTPGYGATKDAKRIPLKDAKTIAKIPTLPISYGDAEPLLAAIGGQVAPRAWRGGLPITYHIGPGPAKVHLKLAFNWDIKPINDVIAKIPGATEPDEWVIRGNHHDAWVNGAEDPISGMDAELEEARSFGMLLKQGWRPRRTIIYCAWDGEEPGLLGSTEWVETHMAELQKHAVMYVNSDNTDRGFLRMDGSQSLEQFINGVARDIPDPEKNMSILERARLRDIWRAKSEEQRNDIRQRKDLRLTAMGSGSDFASFIHHVGIPSLDLSFGGEERGGSAYHSIYDDYTYYVENSDGKFVYGRALAQLAGSAVMRMADAELIPYTFTDYADTIHLYIGQLQKQMQDTRAQIQEQKLQVKEGVYNAVSNPDFPALVPPRPEAMPPYLNFTPMQNAAALFTQDAEQYQNALLDAEQNGGADLTGNGVDAVNQTLIEVERAFLSEKGLPGRPWFKHQIFAPGMYTGYGAKTLPGVREAMEQHNWSLADSESVVIGDAIDAASQKVAKAAEQLNQLDTSKGK
ncbi:MAG TPA: transferrin receptor-like dimerization domain-containing protein [Acidobacteriaceae bacterium]|jgi:N-acetylated-alpha-linked acidic dipeptidase|nr:transferrin receptor-like dimerization domain-containing protein [Acidobacteriaceae bacterium]